MENSEELEIMDVLKIIWKCKIEIVLIIIVTLVLGIYYTNVMIEPKYKSTTKILIDKADGSIENMVNNVEIVNRAVEQLGELNIDSERLIKSKKAEFDKNTKTITLTFTSESPELSYQMVSAYIQPLREKLEEVYSIKLYNIMQEAQIETKPYNINHLKDIIMVLGLGVIIAGAYVLIRAIYRNVITKSSTIENNGLILLGKIKKDLSNDKKTVSYVIRDEKVQEDLRKIIAKIEFNKNIERPKTILFIGAKTKIGNSYVVSNVAFKYAKLGRKVLIIDANLNRPMQHKIFNVNETPGLIDLLISDENNINNYIIQSSIKNLNVLPKGTGKVEETLNIDRFIQILQKLQNKYEIILIDGMPIMEEVLSIALANIVDATVIIVEYEKTQIEDLRNTKRLIEDINGKIAGVIINKT